MSEHDFILFGHWHQPYRPPWWRVVRRWRLKRRRRYVVGTLKSYDEVCGRGST